MADKKISELTNITGANLSDTDEFVVVDTSASETKAITYGELKNINGNLTVYGSGETTVKISSSNGQTPSIIFDRVVGSGWKVGTNTDPDLRFVRLNSDLTENFETFRLESNGDTSFYDASLSVGMTWGYSSGNLGIGTSAPAAGLHLYTTSGSSSIFDRSTDGSHVLFRVGGASAGNITTASLSTTYASTSDYRAKENVTELTGASETLKTLRPVTFNMIGYEQNRMGFIAHEAAEVVPEAVVGEKDAVDESGNPIYQGIDQSKFVPLLTAALQEALERIDALEAQLNK